MPAFFYRSATHADIDQLKDLGLSSYGQYASLMTPENRQKLIDNMGNTAMWEELLNIADGFVCVKDQAIIGMAFLVPSGNPWDIFKAEWSYIRLVGVDPGYNGFGIATELTRQCMAAARARHEKTIALHTSEIMPAARHIYEKMGFTILKEIEPRLGKRYWLYTFDLEQSADTIQYHKATVKDLEILIKYRIEFLKSLGEAPSEAAVEELSSHLRDYFIKALANGSYLCYYATCKNEIAGIGSLVAREQPGHFKNPVGTVGYLINMYTVPAYRRKGICGYLLDRLTDDAKEKGITAFELLATKEGEYVYTQHEFKLHHEPLYRRYTK